MCCWWRKFFLGEGLSRTTHNKEEDISCLAGSISCSSFPLQPLCSLCSLSHPFCSFCWRALVFFHLQPCFGPRIRGSLNKCGHRAGGCSFSSIANLVKRSYGYL